MIAAPDKNAFGAKTTLITVSDDEEWRAWDDWLLPEIRDFLRELPVEFSAAQALQTWREIRQVHMFATQAFLLAEFKRFMWTNVERVREEMRKEDMETFKNATSDIQAGIEGRPERQRVRVHQPRPRNGGGRGYGKPRANHYFAL